MRLFASALFLLTGSVVAYGQPVVVRGPASLALHPCKLPDIDREAQCGTLDVAENPNKPGGRHITLSIAIVPARSGRSVADPIVPLLGGPGESAIDAAGVHERWLRPLLDDRDLLLIDQRGAGKSSPLACDLTAGGDVPLLQDIFPPMAVKKCVKRLGNRADLTQYGFGNFVRDIEQVRQALGYGKLNLFGGSYGTRALQVFLRAYPQSVRTAYLSSVVPIDVVVPQTMATTAQIELENLFSACATDKICHARYPKLREQFIEFMNRLNRGKVYVTLPNQAGRHLLQPGPVASWIRSRLYRPSSAAILPSVINRAYRGDWQPILSGILTSARSDLSFGLFFAITCNEDMRFRARENKSAAAPSFLGDYRVEQQQSACRFWPSSPLPAGYRHAVRSSVPSLFSTGENDGGTPVWFTDHVAKHFENASIVLTPTQGHTEWNDCIATRYFSLVRDERLGAMRIETCPALPRPLLSD